MKKNLFLLTAAIAFIVAFTSCSNNPQAIITAETAAANRTCPQNIGNGLTLTSVEYEGRYVVYYFTGSDDMYFDQSLVTDDMKNQIIQSLRGQAQNNESVKRLLSALKQENVGIIYHYGTSSSVMDVIIEARDL